MKISLEWLGDYIDWTTDDIQQISDRITESTAEVDEVEVQGSLMNNCCVGKIVKLSKHPDADRLSVCTVQTDQGEKPIVCGGTNLREGMNVAFAHTGAKVQSASGELFELKKMKIRGEPSEGMICASVELDLVDMFPESPEQGERPVIDLGDGDENVGTSLRAYLGMTDTILHIDNHAITHRPDLFSHIGFARECVAMGIATWKKDPAIAAPTFTKEGISFSMQVEDTELMPRYCSCIIAIDGLGETPDWMKKRLIATGWRPVNLPVDITNYVMMEVGVPLHSFDADDIKGDIIMRRAKKGEKIVTLDAQERELSEGALILSDDEGIFDLLGIMGGLRSSTKPETKRLYLHSASLDPISVRKAMINMGHRTDAGTTYEKGVPHIITEQGFYRAAELMCELIPGAQIASVMESQGDNGISKTIEVDCDRVRSYLGTNIANERIAEILSGLGFEVEGDSILQVKPPLWRQGDVSGQHDIIEEVGRMHGYNSIDPVLPQANVEPPARQFEVHAMRDRLKELSYTELLPFSFVSPDLLAKTGLNIDEAVEVENPIGEDMSRMQPSTLPRMLEHASQQYRNVNGPLRTFTIANVFAQDVSQHSELALLHMESDTSTMKDYAFYNAKQEVQAACKAAGYDISFKKPKGEAAPYVHPGRSASIILNKNVIGTLCEVHPTVLQNFEIPRRAAVAIINLSLVQEVQSRTKLCTPLPQYPAVTYDVTIERSHADRVSDVIQKSNGASSLLQGVDVIDVFSKSDDIFTITLRFTYRSDEKTLTDEEVKAEHEQVLKSCDIEL